MKKPLNWELKTSTGVKIQLIKDTEGGDIYLTLELNGFGISTPLDNQEADEFSKKFVWFENDGEE